MLLSFSAGIAPAKAVGFVVSNLNDSGPGSLRQAIIDANATEGADKITITTSTTPGTIILLSDLPTITEKLTIEGSGQTVTCDKSCDKSYVFTVTGHLILQNLTISQAERGLYIEEGGIADVAGCTFAGNRRGIFCSGTVIINSCLFMGNNALNDALNGGGIYADGTNLEIINSTFSGNAAGNGGGAYISSSTSTVTNCTFAGNSVTDTGCDLFFNNCNPVITNSIIGDANGLAASGTSTPTVSYSIVRGGWSGTGNIDADPLLSPMGNFGGPVQTVPLLPGSPAIDAGTDTGAPMTDARGINRPQAQGLCDIGAYESRGFTLGSPTGTPQTAVCNTHFAAPLGLTVTSAYGEPVAGGKVTFTAPAAGAGAAITGSPAVIAPDDTVSVSATANGMRGSYSVTASAAGAADVSFNLTNAVLDASISPASAIFDKNTAAQADVTAMITWNDASSVMYVTAGGVSIGAESYDVSGNTLTIRKEYLAGQPVGTLALTVEFDQGDPAALTVTISDTTPPPPSQPPVTTYYAIISSNDADSQIPVNINAGNAVADLGSWLTDAPTGGTTATVTMPDAPNVTSYTLGMPFPWLSDPKGNGQTIFVTAAGSVTLPTDMLAGVTGAEGKSAALTIGFGDKSGLPGNVRDIVGSRPLIRLALTIDGKQTAWKNPDAPVTVSVPYTATAAELLDPEHITVWYIDGSNKPAAVPSGKYHPETGTVTFTVTHFSEYAVVYVQTTFSDLNGTEWARMPIETLASKGIVSGTATDTFSPMSYITRADYVVWLVKALGLTASFDSSFDDVAPGSDCYKEVGIAKQLGITAGCGNNMFCPAESISRQDMMVLTARALIKYKGLKIDSDTAVLNSFGDRNEIAGYAENSLALLIREGLIFGSGSRLNPGSMTTRAEAAAFIYRIYDRYTGV